MEMKLARQKVISTERKRKNNFSLRASNPPYPLFYLDFIYYTLLYEIVQRPIN